MQTDNGSETVEERKERELGERTARNQAAYRRGQAHQVHLNKTFQTRTDKRRKKNKAGKAARRRNRK